MTLYTGRMESSEIDCAYFQNTRKTSGRQIMKYTNVTVDEKPAGEECVISLAEGKSQQMCAAVMFSDGSTRRGRCNMLSHK